MKTFKFFGTATNNNGEFSVRGANDNTTRVIAMNKAGLDNVVLAELPQAMSKLDACVYIQNLEQFASEGQQGAIQNFILNNGGKTAPVTTVIAETPAAPADETPAEKPAKAAKKGGKKSKQAVVEAVETTAPVEPTTTEEPSDAELDAKVTGIVDLGDADDFGTDDFGLGDYAGMVDNYDA